MNKKIRRILMIVLTIILVYSVGRIGYYAKDYYRGQSDYHEAKEQFALPDDIDPEQMEFPGNSNLDEQFKEIKRYFKDCNFDAMKKINNEIYGWLVIPGTNISYPICQHSDNEYYLQHTYSNEANRIGAIFLDYRVSNDFSDYNTIIYGHRLRDQTMFSALKTYRDKETWEKNPYVFVCTLDNEILVYKIYSAFAGDPDGISYHAKITSDKDKQAFIDYTIRCCEYDTKIVPTIEDQFLTLSTCIGTNHTHRMIIHSVLTQRIQR